MEALIYVSLALNTLVLSPICFSMLRDAEWVNATWGPKTPARGILFSIYTAILLASLYFLTNPDPKMVLALLCVQIVYKVTTPFTVGSFRHPVVVSNLAISAIHLVTVVSILPTLS
ncbi:MAG: hypothetical protein KGL41_06455 [Actinomycetales bacterium]|nr:hypothetical protein [Actinomycetales bacterium]